MRSCTGRGALGGARRGRGAAGGRGCPAKGLDGAGGGEAFNGPLVRGLAPRVIYPPKKMNSHWGMDSNLRPERCSFTHPLSSQWRKHSSQWDPRMQAPRGPVKTLAFVRSPAKIGSGMGDRVSPGRGFHAHAPPVCRQPPPPPPAPLLRMRCRKRRRNAQRRVMYVTSGLEKRGASGEYPLSSAPCNPGRVRTLR